MSNWRGNQKNSGFLPEERAWLDDFLAVGFHDTFRQLVGPEAAHYSWWSNRGRARENNVGWRLDYHFTTPGLNQAAHSPTMVGGSLAGVGAVIPKGSRCGTGARVGASKVLATSGGLWLSWAASGVGRPR